MYRSRERRAADHDGRRARFVQRSRRALAIAGGSFLILSGAGSGDGSIALGATTPGVAIGHLFVPRATADTNDLTLLQTGFFGPGSPYVVPFDGVLTSWSVMATTSPTQFAFKVGRPATPMASDGTGDFTIVASSALLTLVPDQLNTYNVSIPVRAGDVLGSYQPGPFGLFEEAAPGSSEQAISTNGDAPTGSTAHYDYEVIDARHHTSPNFGGLRVPMSAYVEPDTDHDAAADVSQDRCPGRFGTAQGCPVADLGVSQTASAASVLQGRAIVYQVVVTNHGPDPVPAVTVSDPLPAGATLLSAGPSAGTCSAGPDLRCDLGALASSGSATIKLVIQADAAGPLATTATAGATAVPAGIGAGDPNSANDSATLTTDVQAEPLGLPTGPPAPTGILPPSPVPPPAPVRPGTPPPFRGVVFHLNRHAISVTNGLARISLSSTVAARGKLKLTTVVSRHKTALLGEASFSLAAGRPRTIALRLTRLGLTLARTSGKKRTVLASATASTTSSQTKTTKASATLGLVQTR